MAITNIVNSKISMCMFVAFIPCLISLIRKWLRLADSVGGLQIMAVFLFSPQGLYLRYDLYSRPNHLYGEKKTKPANDAFSPWTMESTDRLNNIKQATLFSFSFDGVAIVNEIKWNYKNEILFLFVFHMLLAKAYRKFFVGKLR